ncbi:AAA family ATPase [Listeria booriae]|uniref:AAA family ATPase n=1 Tax=Listeria booriae TaxID=1552123 RepID=UPI00162A9477|nr:ATP-binding protein [Listeria booriae]MBC2105558.1 AAA family ATPase [Listeria booriae]
MISKLEIINWKQLATVNLEFHSNLTIIAGANGSGKSTVLRAISRTIGWDYEEVAKFEERKDYEKNESISDYDYMDRYSSSVAFNKKVEAALNEINAKKDMVDKNLNSEIDDQGGNRVVGEIVIDNQSYDIYIPKVPDDATYSIFIYKEVEVEENGDTYYSSNWPDARGVFISSHRMPYIYSNIEYISSRVLEKEAYYNQYKEEFINRQVYRYNEPNSVTPFSVLKNSLVTYSLHQANNGPSVMDEFIDILKAVLPVEFGFKGIEVRNGEIVLQTDHTDVLLDSISGGISSIIDIAWQIFMTNKESPFIVIDEIENHLHPSMQRRILPDLIKAFPKTQFIVSTHSPFVINSVPDCNLYVLQKNSTGKFDSILLDLESHLTDAVDVLKDVLGVSVTLPIWREQELDRIMEKYSGEYLNERIFLDLKSELEKIGMDNYLPETLRSLNLKKDDSHD